jgi:CRISPR-associated protein Csb1
MSLDLSGLASAPRLLIEAELKPLQGDRFQPTGFPNLGAALYKSPTGSDNLLVESPQSVANHLESVCWDEIADDWVKPLRGLPVIKVIDDEGKSLTNSVLEAHRINSEYIARADGFDAIRSELNFLPDHAFDVRHQLVPILLKYDPNSLIHGVFLEEVAGVIRLPRTLSGFIEARDVRIAQNGGVKFNRIEQRAGGEGNVPYARDEYTAAQITGYFNLDLAQIRAFGLERVAEQLLVALALFKIRKFLSEGLRLRTACDLDVTSLDVVRPIGFVVPTLPALEQVLPELIAALASEGGFATPPTTTLKWQSKGRRERRGGRSPDPIPTNQQTPKQ